MDFWACLVRSPMKQKFESENDRAHLRIHALPSHPHWLVQISDGFPGESWTISKMLTNVNIPAEKPFSFLDSCQTDLHHTATQHAPFSEPWGLGALVVKISFQSPARSASRGY